MSESIRHSPPCDQFQCHQAEPCNGLDKKRFVRALLVAKHHDGVDIDASSLGPLAVPTYKNNTSESGERPQALVKPTAERCIEGNKMNVVMGLKNCFLNMPCAEVQKCSNLDLSASGNHGYNALTRAISNGMTQSP